MTHAFVDSGQVWRDRSGRSLRVCAVCERPRVGVGHRTPTVVDPEPEASAARAADPPRPAAPASEPWELALLRIACERVLELPALGWRLRLRVADVRAALDIVGDMPLEPTAEEARVPAQTSPPTASAVVRRLARDTGLTPRAIRKQLRTTPFWPLVRRALDEGWTAERRNGHMRLLNPDGDGVVVLATTTTERSRVNYLRSRAEAKRAGLNVEGI